MTESKANEILRTKYPEAEITRRNNFGGVSSSCLAVTFKPQGKVYSYQGSSYQQVLEKLGFKILYKHNVKAMNERIEKLQKEIENGGYEPLFDLQNREYINYTDDEINEMQKEIEKIKKDLEDSILV